MMKGLRNVRIVLCCDFEIFVVVVVVVSILVLALFMKSSSLFSIMSMHLTSEVLFSCCSFFLLLHDCF